MRIATYAGIVGMCLSCFAHRLHAQNPIPPLDKWIIQEAPHPWTHSLSPENASFGQKGTWFGRSRLELSVDFRVAKSGSYVIDHYAVATQGPAPYPENVYWSIDGVVSGNWIQHYDNIDARRVAVWLAKLDAAKTYKMRIWTWLPPDQPSFLVSRPRIREVSLPVMLLETNHDMSHRAEVCVCFHSSAKGRTFMLWTGMRSMTPIQTPFGALWLRSPVHLATASSSPWLCASTSDRFSVFSIWNRDFQVLEFDPRMPLGSLKLGSPLRFVPR